MFVVTTFGESHGPVIGCVVDGCPPNIELTEEDFHHDLQRRRPGQSKYVSQRRETDDIKILSGVFEGKTTGTPINLQIDNIDAKDKDYADLKHKYRPGHGDYTVDKKYGIRDYRGGGRSSARETVARVAAGVIAKKYLREKLDINFAAKVTQVGDTKGDIAAMEELIESVRREGDSIGAKIELIISNMPVGLGEPVFDRIDADLAHAMLSINATKGVEFGAGFACVSALGSKYQDAITPSGFVGNNAGGVLGGISSGQDICLSVAFKPAASIRLPQDTVDVDNIATQVVTTGRHDPCVGWRAPVIVEAMASIVICDHVLRHRGQNGHFI